MKKILCLVALIFAFAKTEAQYRVVFKLNKFPAAHTSDSIYISGSFNRWVPASDTLLFTPNNDHVLQVSIRLAADDYEYKCVRGSWQKTETQPDGKSVQNRFLRLQSDTTIEINIEAWQDDFAPAEKQHTAGRNVQIADTAFFMPQLNRTRKIWIYLPGDYLKSKKHYPVMYMHDGQNLFDEYTSGYGEWGVDECLDSLIAKGKQACIVVGIENGAQRFNEYNPFYFERFGKGEGDAYLAFLTETLKPYIDKRYRTLSSKENTLIAGSSMGGLISYYAMLKRPDIFGKGGIFSPAFWTAAAIKPLTDSLAGKMNGKLFFYMGGKEGGSYIQDMLDVRESLGKKSSAMIYSLIHPYSMHNEQAWRKWFAEFYNWIMADGFNYVVKTKE